MGTKGLGIANIDLSDVNHKLFADALASIERLDLSGTDVGEGQTDLLFRRMITSTNIKVLDLGFTSLGDINDNTNSVLFGRALSRVEQLRMIGASVTGGQMQQLFKRMCLKDSKLKELFIEDVKFEESLVNPYFLAGGLNKLTKLSMADASISTEQVLELFSRISRFTHLEYLDVSFLDLSAVPDFTLASAIHKVEKVIMADCCLADGQINAIFQPSNRLAQYFRFSGVKTTFLDLSFVFLGNMDNDLMARAVVEIETVRMVECDLTQEQVESILLLVSDRTKIKKFELSVEDLLDVSEEVIEETKLGDFKVVGCNEQYEYDEDNWLSFSDS